jgi:diguanylate cyclase (GGDEF)-like protein
MNNLGPSLMRSEDQTPPFVPSILLALFGLVAPMATYALAVSPLAYKIKIAGLATVAAVYAVVCVWSFSKLRAAGRLENEQSHSDKDDLLDSHLEAFDDARHFFGASLNSGDMFRLVTSRVGEIFPHKSAMLFLADNEKGVLRICEVDGDELDDLKGVEVETDAGLSGLAFLSGEPEIDMDMRLTRSLLSIVLPPTIGAAVAVPLVHEDLTFGVLQLLLTSPPENADAARAALEPVAQRISPLFLSSISFERSLSNAMTDPLTGLPNERSFFMVLENQLAESQRFRDERSLTVLAIDVKGFDELNQKFGHATGDKTLQFVAEKLRTELRKMDFLARSASDEFLVVLPTANEQTAAEIVERINEAFNQLACSIDDVHQFYIRLNFGSATFWRDGETAKQLMQHANLKKQQTKSEEQDNVIWFPKEYVN